MPRRAQEPLAHAGSRHDVMPTSVEVEHLGEHLGSLGEIGLGKSRSAIG